MLTLIITREAKFLESTRMATGIHRFEAMASQHKYPAGYIGGARVAESRLQMTANGLTIYGGPRVVTSSQNIEHRLYFGATTSRNSWSLRGMLAQDTWTKVHPHKIDGGR